jgi:hypothetical protein
MTHFAEATANGGWPWQMERFPRIAGDWMGPVCLAIRPHSCATRTAHGDWVRPGIMLYGASPFAETVGPGAGLQPVMAGRVPLIGVQQLAAGEAGRLRRTFTAERRYASASWPVAMPTATRAMRRPARRSRCLAGGRGPLAGCRLDMLALRHHRYSPKPVWCAPVTLWGEWPGWPGAGRRSGGRRRHNFLTNCSVPWRRACRLRWAGRPSGHSLNGQGENGVLLHRMRCGEPEMAGQCPGCNAWNTLVEAGMRKNRRRTAASSRSPRPPGCRIWQTSRRARPSASRPASANFDRALGGGLVAGGVVLIGG